MSEPYYGWAVDAVEGLHWLVDLDDWAFTGTRENLKGRDPKVIDVVHVRWATSTAVTALDLCGVELAVRYGALDFWTNKAPVLDQVEADVGQAGGMLPEWAREWLGTALSDPGYKALKATRDPLIHRFLVRSALLWTTVPTGHQWRTEFDSMCARSSMCLIPGGSGVVLQRGSWSCSLATWRIDTFARSVVRLNGTQVRRPRSSSHVPPRARVWLACIVHSRERAT